MPDPTALDEPVVEITAPEKPVKTTTSDIKDTRDVSPRAPKPNTKGERVRAIPAKGGTTVEVKKADFAAHGIDNPTVTWDFRKDNFTVPVGPVLSKAAADFLCETFPTSFEYMGR